MTTETCEVRAIPGTDIEGVHRELVDIFRAVFCLPPYDETEDDVEAFAERVRDDAEHPGFRCSIARGAPDGPVLGVRLRHAVAAGERLAPLPRRGLRPRAP